MNEGLEVFVIVHVFEVLGVYLGVLVFQGSWLGVDHLLVDESLKLAFHILRNDTEVPQRRKA